MSWDEARGLVKVNPVATWTDADIANYEADHGLPVHPLMSQGYLLDRLRADDASGRAGRGPSCRAVGGHGQDRVRPSRLMAHDPDNPLGVQIRGNERGMPFVHPYRHIGELNQVERWKLERHPLEVADAVISRYAKEGAGAHRHGAGRGRSGSSGSASIPSAKAATPS